VVKVVTLLVSPQEAERLALASREGTLRLAMRNYSDNKIVLTSGTDVAQMLRAYSLAPDVPVMPAQPAIHHAMMAPRPKPIEIEILRNGKSSESVSFVNEAAVSATSAKHRAARRAPAPEEATADDDTDAAAPAAAPSVASASAGEAEHHATVAAPMSADIKTEGSAASASATGYVPTPKTIDIP
jgi:hypothetical protein